jgi:hypothetical protein
MWAKMSFRSSYSMRREARISDQRIAKRKIPWSATARRMSPASPSSAPRVAPFCRWSTDWRTSHGTQTWNRFVRTTATAPTPNAARWRSR